MNSNQNPVENFLQSVCKFIATEEKAKNIQDELKDHIYSYVEEYTNDGINYDDTMILALKQMGDPDILCESFKDKTNKVSLIFRVTSVTMLTLLIIISDFFYLSINGYNSMEGICYMIIFIILSSNCIKEVIDFIRINKKNKLLSNKNPLFYIQSYKQSIWDEKALKIVQLFFIGFCIVLSISLLGKLSNLESKDILSSVLRSINSISFVILMALSFSIVNPKKKNAIVYDEGLLMYNSYIPFDQINGYMWTKEKIKNKTYYSLDFATKNNSFLDKKSFFHNTTVISGDRAPIKVSASQITLLNELFKKHNIDEINS